MLKKHKKYSIINTMAKAILKSLQKLLLNGGRNYE